MRGMLYAEDRLGNIYRVNFTPPASGYASLEQQRQQFEAEAKAKGTRLRVPAGGATTNPYSVFRCSGCHRPIQASRYSVACFRAAKAGSRFIPSLYQPMLPLKSGEFAKIDAACWFGGTCPDHP